MQTSSSVRRSKGLNGGRWAAGWLTSASSSASELTRSSAASHEWLSRQGGTQQRAQQAQSCSACTRQGPPREKGRLYACDSAAVSLCRAPSRSCRLDWRLSSCCFRRRASCLADMQAVDWKFVKSPQGAGIGGNSAAGNELVESCQRQMVKRFTCILALLSFAVSMHACR